MLKIGRGEHNSERSIETIKECLDFLGDNFSFRVDQGLHDLNKLPPAEASSIDEMPPVNREKSEDEPEQKSLLDMIIDSQRDSSKPKIQIAPHLSLFSCSRTELAVQADTVDFAKVPVEDLDESMMELSQQVEELMTKQNTIVSYNPIIKLRTLSERSESHMGGANSPEPFSIKCMEDGIMSDLKIITPFAIQTKASKK